MDKPNKNDLIFKLARMQDVDILSYISGLDDEISELRTKIKELTKRDVSIPASTVKNETLVCVGYSVVFTNDEPCFDFILKSKQGGIPFDYENINTTLISMAQALSDAYQDLRNGSAVSQMGTIRSDFQKRALLPLHN
ncbi:MAG: hypothetical protein RR091_12455 [Cloacibacillus sp.]